MYDNLTFAQDRSGILWAIRVGKDPKPILAPGHEFHNLFAASALMYRVMKDSEATLEAIIRRSEAIGDDEGAAFLQNVASNLNLACRAAEEGLRIFS